MKSFSISKEKTLWYFCLGLLLVSETYALILNKNGIGGLWKSLVLVLPATFIIYSYIFKKEIHMGGFSVKPDQKGMRLFCLYTAALFLFLNFEFMF